MAQLLYHRLNGLFGYLHRLRRNTNLMIVAHVDHRLQRHHCLELHRVSLHDLNLRLGNGFKLLLLKGFVIGTGDQLFDHVIDQPVTADMPFEYGTRRLSLPEAGDVHLPDQPAIDALRGFLHLSRVHLDGQIDLMVLRFLVSDLHDSADPTLNPHAAAGAAPPTALRQPAKGHPA